MEEKDIPDLNIFMMCEEINKGAFRDIPSGYHIRKLKPNELKLWMEFPFDNLKDKVEYLSYMQEYYANVYASRSNEFYNRCLVICDDKDKPIGTCFAWKAYNKFWTIHWFKTEKDSEGKGLGKAILTEVMKTIPEGEFPVYLHTQPASFRAIKIYSDFGFKILKDKKIGNRQNDYKKSKKYLKHFMGEHYKALKFARSNGEFSKCAALHKHDEF